MTMIEAWLRCGRWLLPADGTLEMRHSPDGTKPPFYCDPHSTPAGESSSYNPVNSVAAK